ncbi:uncharacterized protein LOC124362011 [Homalodisca vitripennis]|uniref:uncharacterized protein LOC124362011 n=1 Tax=Homalodisca vitripennis TaxID=197043 RepID=UPI001EEC8A35|nr:uncharacterized protein LOC124362011 [Homalodisca vitripennis]
MRLRYGDTPIAFSRCNIFCQEALLKAFFTSKRTTAGISRYCRPPPTARRTNLMTMSTASTVERPGLKPNWLSDKALVFSSSSCSLPTSSCSNSFPTVLSRHSGLYESGLPSGLPNFGMRTSLAIFQPARKLSSLRAIFNTLRTLSGTTLTATFTTSGGMPSGPGLLLDLIFFPATISSFLVKGGISRATISSCTTGGCSGKSTSTHCSIVSLSSTGRLRPNLFMTIL